MTSTLQRPQSPFAHLGEQEREKLGKELDAIHDEVFADLGDRDRAYIKKVITVQRQIVVAGRVLLLGSRSKTAWVLGTACLGMAKILENMEIGHNVMHGQWDWMNDPDIHSSVWDWDTASSAESWKHSHNFIHHTYTNIRGKDKDLGYEIMRIDPHQPWKPAYLGQFFYNALLTVLFEWGVAVHDMDIEAIRAGEKPWSEVRKDLKGIGVKARSQILKDYIGWPVISAGAFALVQLASGGRLEQPAKSRLGRRLRKISSGRPRRRHGEFPGSSGARGGKHLPAHFDRRRCRECHPQCVGARHHLLRPLSRPDLHIQPRRGRGRNARGVVPAPVGRRGQHRRQPTIPCDQRQPRLPSRAPFVSRTCRPVGTPRSRPRSRTSASVMSCRTTPGASPSSGSWCTAPSFDWHSPAENRGQSQVPTTPRRVAPPRHESSEATKFRDRVPAEHPAAGPEHDSSGVEVQPPPARTDD